MQIHTTILRSKKPIIISFTEKPISSWGGLSLLAGYSQQIGLIEHIKKKLPFKITSPNATPAVDIVLSFMIGVLTGARRFSHIETLRHDEVIKQLFGIRRFPSDLTIMRFFKRFGRAQIEEVFVELRRWLLGIITPDGSYTIDLDSSVIERYGKQEGALLGYNPKKHRRPSHHPIFATLDKNGAIVNAWLRSGNSASATGSIEFLEEALAIVPEGVKIDIIRGDSGFDSGRFFDYLESKGKGYAISARFTSGVKRAVGGIKDWREIDADTSVSEIEFKANSWSKGRKLIVIRQRDRKNDYIRGRELFDYPGYVYQGIFSNLEMLPEDIWRFYRQRANLENRIRELKWDYGIDGFCMKKFFATEAAFQMICFTYNLMQQFQKELGFKMKKTLGVIRMMVLSCGAELGRNGRDLVLRLSVTRKRRGMFEEFSNRIFHWGNGNCVSVGSG